MFRPMLRDGEQMVDIYMFDCRLIFILFSLRHVSPTYMICHEREAVVKRKEHFKIDSYTCIFLSKMRSFLDFRFSLKCVYLLCKFQRFETLEYIFQDHLMISHCE